ncbi:MAG: hypothetical protein IKI88_07320 [Anaerotignum sp.]|nr:hypothetical protein [Anaerotignum sp.]
MGVSRTSRFRRSPPNRRPLAEQTIGTKKQPKPFFHTLCSFRRRLAKQRLY